MKRIPTGSTLPLNVVAAALIDRSGRLLLQQRPVGKHHGGLWEFPGGKVEQGETFENALIREIEEELGLSLDESGISLIATARQGAEAAHAELVLFLYTASRWAGQEQGHDGQEWGWFSFDQAAELPLAPLDRQLLHEIAQKLV